MVGSSATGRGRQQRGILLLRGLLVLLLLLLFLWLLWLLLHSLQLLLLLRLQQLLSLLWMLGGRFTRRRCCCSCSNNSTCSCVRHGLRCNTSKAPSSRWYSSGSKRSSRRSVTRPRFHLQRRRGGRRRRGCGTEQCIRECGLGSCRGESSARCQR